MKILLTKAKGDFADEDSLGKVHLEGPRDSTACGLAYEEYDSKSSSKALSCSTCIDIFNWAKEVSRKVRS